MIRRAFQLVHNMGVRYITFRIGFELKKKLGILKRKFPINPKLEKFYSLESWRESATPFFFKNREDVGVNRFLSDQLKNDYADLKRFNYPFFSSLSYDLGEDYDWITNPDSGYKYDPDLHWLDINDYDKAAGDIKFVWEPSRFSHLYTIIRYDYHSGEDCSKRVFSEIEKWLDSNKINQGPNFKCSQEISLRVMNWVFALYYYKNSSNLTIDLFDRIQQYIYWQVEHVYQNINFSRIAVRNNHAITETLLLYIAGLLFPDFPGAKKWKKNGKKWFEQEIAYQIYEDGTFLQFSMNYHRVVIQLLTWGIQLAELNKDPFNDIVYLRAKKSVSFLKSSMDKETGWLPNYGNNDGALFFKLSDAMYRDYRPQLEALSYALKIQWEYKNFEDSKWYCLTDKEDFLSLTNLGAYNAFENGGYYLYNTNKSLSFIRCGNHKDRPAQADNLHFDLWYDNKNILHDSGSYKYNSGAEDLKYFMGTQSHNTVMLGSNDQMEKGARFIWYHWTQCKEVIANETDEFFIFEGTIKAFQHIDKSILHKRVVKVFKNINQWEIIDQIVNKPANLELKQIWHTCFPMMLNFNVMAPSNKQVPPTINEGYYSSFYGIKEPCTELIFSTKEDSIKTIITITE